MCRGKKGGRTEGRRVGAAWLGGVQPRPPTTTLTLCAAMRKVKEERGRHWTSSLPLHAVLGPRQEMKRTKTQRPLCRFSPPSSAATAAAAPAQRRTRREAGREEGKMAPPAEGRGEERPVPPHSGRAAASICRAAAAASRGQGWSRGRARPRFLPGVAAAGPLRCGPRRAASRRCCLSQVLLACRLRGGPWRPWQPRSPLSAGRSWRVAVRVVSAAFGAPRWERFGERRPEPPQSGDPLTRVSGLGAGGHAPSSVQLQVLQRGTVSSAQGVKYLHTFLPSEIPRQRVVLLKYTPHDRIVQVGKDL